jgi:hypothetical protein
MKFEILVRTKMLVGVTAQHFPGPAVGDRVVFDNDLVLERYKNQTPGHGLPSSEPQRFAGTHSGTVTLLRIATASDRFYPPTSFLIQYVGTYKFNTVANTPLEKGQVTTQGLFRLDKAFNPIETPIRFAVTGGTDAYVGASGQVTEGVTPDAENRLLEFEA